MPKRNRQRRLIATCIILTVGFAIFGLNIAIKTDVLLAEIKTLKKDIREQKSLSGKLEERFLARTQYTKLEDKAHDLGMVRPDKIHYFPIKSNEKP